MVRFLQHILILSGVILAAEPAAPKFYIDDPLAAVPEPGKLGEIGRRNPDALYDFLYQSLRARDYPVTPSQAVNTLGEVPNSSWYTNRHATRRMTTEELKRGPGDANRPVPPYEVIGGKTEGITPGFTLRDSRGKIYFVKPDPESNPELATAADVIGSKFFYALGYNTPENYILYFRLAALKIDEKATVRGVTGRKRRMNSRDLAIILDKVPRSPDGRMRVIASLALSGEVIGPFKYEGTRSDDPNDIIPHERRRDLRGLHVFCAWLNHTDSKQGNTLDTLMKDGARQFIRHHLIDFGAMLGSDSDRAKDARLGNGFIFPTGKETLRGMGTFGFAPHEWELAEYPHLKAVGRLESSVFDPELWHSNYPNPAFLSRTAEDEFWAAKQVMAFTNADIKALVETGQYSDPRVPEYITSALIERRAKIGRAFFKKVLAVDNFRVEDGRLRFQDLSFQYGFTGQRAFQFAWAQYDNSAGRADVLANEISDKLPTAWAAAGEGTYFRAEIRAAGDDARRSIVYLRKRNGAAQVVGIQRIQP
jgi:hypothetical protein